jgi:hypothetical protein
MVLPIMLSFTAMLLGACTPADVSHAIEARRPMPSYLSDLCQTQGGDHVYRTVKGRPVLYLPGSPTIPHPGCSGVVACQEALALGFDAVEIDFSRWDSYVRGGLPDGFYRVSLQPVGSAACRAPASPGLLSEMSKLGTAGPADEICLAYEKIEYVGAKYAAPLPRYVKDEKLNITKIIKEIQVRDSGEVLGNGVSFLDFSAWSPSRMGNIPDNHKCYSSNYITILAGIFRK